MLVLIAYFCIHTGYAAGSLHSTLLCLVDVPSTFQPLLADYPKLPTLPASSSMLHLQTVNLRHCCTGGACKIKVCHTVSSSYMLLPGDIYRDDTQQGPCHGVSESLCDHHSSAIDSPERSRSACIQRQQQQKQAWSRDRQPSAYLADFGCLELCVLENKYDSLRRGRYCFLLSFYRWCAKTSNHINYVNICSNANCLCRTAPGLERPASLLSMWNVLFKCTTPGARSNTQPLWCFENAAVAVQPADGAKDHKTNTVRTELGKQMGDLRSTATAIGAATALRNQCAACSETLKPLQPFTSNLC